MAVAAGAVALDPDGLDAGLVLDERVLVPGLGSLLGGLPPQRHVVEHVAGVVGQLNDPHAAPSVRGGR